MEDKLTEFEEKPEEEDLFDKVYPWVWLLSVSVAIFMFYIF